MSSYYQFLNQSFDLGVGNRRLHDHLDVGKHSNGGLTHQVKHTIVNAVFYLADLNTCLAVTQEGVEVITIAIEIEQPVHVRAIGVDSRTLSICLLQMMLLQLQEIRFCIMSLL